MIIISDYGHGFITNKVTKTLTSAKVLALNAQINSSNIGYKTMKNFRD